VRQEPSFFEGHEPVLVYIAKKLKDALRLEAALTEAGVDYGVETDEYRGGVLFRGVRTGAFFYVLPAALEQVLSVMQKHSFTPHPEAGETHDPAS
jgi:hypothetical protein